MDLDTAIGELIVGRIPGTELDDDNRDALEKGIISGITLFKDNVRSLQQTMQLVDSIRKHSLAVPIITADEEGGAVQRFDQIVTPLPSAMALGALRRHSRVRDIAQLSARHLKLLGLNCVLAPVLDVATNPRNPIIATRAYSSSPQLVAKYGAITAETFLDNNILPVGKHFPGHGDTSQDSHTDLPALTFDRKRLETIELYPFRECLNDLPAILTAHIWLTEFEPEPVPASLSRRITTSLLREELGFDGLVFTDDMLMKAVDEKWGYVEGSVLALLAGADQLLICADASHSRKVHAKIKEAVKAGRLSESRLHESIQRRRKAMQKAGIDQPPPPVPIDERISEIEKSRVEDSVKALRVTDPAITLIRGESVPDLRQGGEWIVIVPDHPRYRLNVVSELRKLIKHENLVVKEYRVPLNPDEKEVETIAHSIGKANYIFLTYKGLRNAGQLTLAHALSEKALSTTAVATDVPEDLAELPDWENAIATYDPSEQAMEVLAHIFAGWGIRTIA